MRILVISNVFPRYEGDFSGNFVYELSKKLKETTGFDIIILTPHNPGSKLTEEMGNLKVYRFPYFYPYKYQKMHIDDIKQKNFLIYLQAPFFFLSELLYAIRIIINEDIDIIHSQFIMPSSLIGGLCRKIFKIPNISTLHSSEVTLLQKLPLKNKVAKYILDSSDGFTSVSSHRANEFLKIVYPDTNIKVDDMIKIIPMGVDSSSFKQYKDKLKLRETYMIDSMHVVLFVGRLVEVKGCEYLIRSFSNVVEKISDIQLLIVGSGSLEPKLKRIVADLNLEEYIRFVGPVNRDKISDFYSLSDIVVFPSIVESSGFEEGIPVVVLEALMSGKPVIATKTKGVMEVIVDGYNGLLVAQKDPDQIAEAIVTLLNNTELTEVLSEHALVVGSNYDWSAITEKYAEIFEDIHFDQTINVN